MDDVANTMGVGLLGGDESFGPGLSDELQSYEDNKTISDILNRNGSEPRKKKKKLQAATRLRLILGTTVVVWVSIGTLFYSLNEGWEWWRALFFAVNVGLGVGYGENSVRQPSSFAFTIGFVIVGASFIAAGLVMLFQFVVELRDTRIDQVQSLGGDNKEQIQKRELDIRNALGRFGYFWAHRKGRCMLLGAWLFWVFFGAFMFRYGDRNAEDRNMLHCSHVQVADGEFENFCDSFLWALMVAITSMSTAAQGGPKDNEGAYLFSTFWIWIGIPLFAAVSATVADILVQHYSRVQSRHELEDQSITPKDLYKMQKLTCARQKVQADEANCMGETIDAEVAQLFSPRATETPGGWFRGAQAEGSSGSLSHSPTLGPLAQDRMVPDENGQIDYGAFLEYQLRSLRAVDRKLLNMLRQAFISLDQEKNGYFTPADLKDFRIRTTSFSGNYMPPAQGYSGGVHDEMDEMGLSRERGASVMSVPMISPRETTLARSGAETPTSRF